MLIHVWIYPCIPSNGSNTLTHTLFDFPPCSPEEDECYDPMDSFKISLFGEPDFVSTIEMHDNDEFCLIVDHENLFYVIVILLSLFMMILKISMREENMVVGILMLLKHLSLC